MNADGIVIRAAAPADVEAIVRLHAASWRENYRGVFPDAFLDGDLEAELTGRWRGHFDAAARSWLAVALEGGEVAGLSCVEFEETGLAYIDHLHVRAVSASRGIGARLLAAGLEEASRRGAAGAYLWVFESNARAVAFYLRHGGRIAERTAEKEIFGISPPTLRIAFEVA